MAPRRRSPLRVLAPLALVAFAVALIVVVSSSGVDDNKAGSSRATQTSGSARSQHSSKPRRRTYTIKPGDTLAAISQKVGISVAKLQELNPALDPQSLVAGQKIKLRE